MWPVVLINLISYASSLVFYAFLIVQVSLECIVFLDYGTAGGVCGATDTRRTGGDTAKHCQPITLYEFLIFVHLLS
jgi:hypothetical protein